MQEQQEEQKAAEVCEAELKMEEPVERDQPDPWPVDLLASPPRGEWFCKASNLKVHVPEQVMQRLKRKLGWKGQAVHESLDFPEEVLLSKNYYDMGR